jgi:hypothetical protein
MIRGHPNQETINHPQNKKHLSDNRAHEGLQSPSDLKEKKRIKEAHFAFGPRPSTVVRPVRTRGTTSASLKASPPKPLTALRASASLEGSGPTLGRAN